MYKHKKSIISLLLLLLILISPIQSYAETQESDTEYFHDVLDLVQDRYVDQVPLEEDLDNSIDELFNRLDRYSDYYTEEEFKKLNEDLEGNFVGIGVYITEEDGYIKIVRPINGSPAEKAGLSANDIITSVDAKSIRDMPIDDVTDLIMGELGTTVRLRVKSNQYTKVFNVKRDRVVIDPVQYHVIDDIGYIILEKFTFSSYRMMRDTLKHMEELDIDKIILDLRNNPGGYLDEALGIANLFVPKGPVVHIKYGEDDMETHDSKLEKIKYDLVVLINGGSASASEILAAAVKDTESGTLVGTTSYGKGTVQEVITLPKGDGVKITVAEYFSPNMNKIDGLGIIPDIIVDNQKGQDTQLKTAIELLMD